MADLTEARVTVIPKCDICRKMAAYDARLYYGTWAFVCEYHFKLYGVGLGMGKGQKLVLVTPEEETPA